MMQRGSARNQAQAHVVIAGGGFAALEAAVALTALAQERTRLTLVSPDVSFRYHPAATAEILDSRPPQAYDLRPLVEGLGASYVMDRVVAVAPREKSLTLASGRRVSYDTLILAMGARRSGDLPGALTFRDQRDVPLLRQVLSDARATGHTQLVFAVPSLRTWALPAYELALFASRRLKDAGCWPEVTLVTPEPKPLCVFGNAASQSVAELLAWHDIHRINAATPRAVASDGSLELDFDGRVRADKVIALPDLSGRRISGIPGRWLGFIPTDSAGRVEGLTDVYAIGDATSFPVKQGGLGTQQADYVAHTIAGGLGAPVRELHLSRILQAQLLGGHDALLLRAELDEFGRPGVAMAAKLRPEVVSGRSKVDARYLAPYLARFEPAGGRVAA